MSRRKRMWKNNYIRLKGGCIMTNRNGSKGSGNQGSPQAGQYQMEFGSEFQTGDDNKGKEYNSHKGSKSKKKHED
jgi:hypothetical protein